MSLQQWGDRPDLRAELVQILESEAFCAALELIMAPQIPAKMAGVSDQSIANTHQFQAGFFAVYRGLTNLSTHTNEGLQRKAAAAKLEAQGAWSGETIPPPPNE